MPPRTTIAAAAAVAAGVAAISAHFWRYLWCGDCLAEWASFVTIVSLVVAPLWYLLKRETDRRGEVETISSSLYMELADARDGLDDDGRADLRAVRLQDGTQVRFTNLLFNHDIYDSLIHSGRINAIRAEHQQQVQDVFQLVKDHNASLKKMRETEGAKGCEIHDEPYYYDFCP